MGNLAPRLACVRCHSGNSCPPSPTNSWGEPEYKLTIIPCFIPINGERVRVPHSGSQHSIKIRQLGPSLSTAWTTYPSASAARGRSRTPRGSSSHICRQAPRARVSRCTLAFAQLSGHGTPRRSSSCASAALVADRTLGIVAGRMSPHPSHPAATPKELVSVVTSHGS